MAGLSAAWRLKHHDILLLESNCRVGGRIRSERRGYHWLNWGGHVFAGDGSASDELFRSVGIEARTVPGVLSGMYMNGKLLTDGRVETYPFKIPMSWKARFSLIRAGAKVRAAVFKYGKVASQRPGEDSRVHQQRIFDFMNDQTFSDFLGELPMDADAIFRPTVSRSTGDPEVISAGAGVGYFYMIWNKDEGLAKNILGGPSTLTETIATVLGNQVQLNANVKQVVQDTNSVKVSYSQHGTEYEEEARYVVLATPAPITRKIAVNIKPQVGEALDKIVYGPHVSASFLTNETGPQVWDNLYSIATPKKSFDILIHNSNLIHSLKTERQPGSSFMTFSPAQRGHELINKTDEEIIQTYIKDLNDIFPGIRNHIVEAEVNRWPLGSAYVFPGRAKLQSVLTEPSGRLFLAGDYLGSLYTETAVQTGFNAAQNINSLLGTCKQEKNSPDVARYVY
ncbi:NAD(P)/FAD-dependent oxidoreductase [Salirhabdus salicampi]|uniref:NAD(P)/FAD-dependent oxidoreductase n=1 Tax=Salirhabdus salicampi TaxID=476102 RepID=UPI0020C4C3DF|nr:FAD-dependent oxidoreductase [Salirhabdus salicampi]